MTPVQYKSEAPEKTTTHTHTHQLTIDDVKGRAGLVGDSARNERLATAWGPIQQDALGGLHANGLEELGVAQRQLDQLTVVTRLGRGRGGGRQRE